jgi:hypothetical protein
MSDRIDPVWEYRDNIYLGFKYKYCKKHWKWTALHVLNNTLHCVGECARLSQRSVRSCQLLLREIDKGQYKRKSKNGKGSTKVGIGGFIESRLEGG